MGASRLRLEVASTPVHLNIRPDWRQTLTALAGIGSVLAVALGLLYTNDANRKQLATMQQGQFTDRFNKAIEQLGQEGNDKLSVRLGGVYALERLMSDSGRDEPTVIEVLCAFVRTHAAASSSLPTAAPPPSPPDIAAAVTALARRPRPRDPSNAHIDLAGTVLSMPNAKLDGANLDGVYLGYANLRGANLNYAHLMSVDLHNANLDGAHLDGADLRATDLQTVTLRGATLRGANLELANMSGLDLSGMYLAGANLRLASLKGADLAGSDLGGANLHFADLRNTNLRSAYLWTAEGLWNGQLQCSWADERTHLPAAVARPAADSPINDPACKD